MKEKGRILWRYTKNWHILDLNTQKIVWELPDCEYVKFSGKNALKLGTLQFKQVKVKNREVGDAPSDDEDFVEHGENIPLKLEHENDEHLSDDLTI